MTAINCQQTRIETTHRILNGDLNEHGTLFGGRLLEAVDAEASVAAMRVAGCHDCQSSGYWAGTSVG